MIFECEWIKFEGNSTARRSSEPLFNHPGFLYHDHVIDYFYKHLPHLICFTLKHLCGAASDDEHLRVDDHDLKWWHGGSISQQSRSGVVVHGQRKGGSTRASPISGGMW